MRRALPFLVVLLLAAPPAEAAPFGYADPAGDVVTADAAHDIRSVTWSTKGTGRGAAYRPTHVVVRLVLGAPPVAGPGIEYAVYARDVPDCGGDLSFHYVPGSVHGSSVGTGYALGECVDGVPTLGGVTFYQRVLDTVVKGNAVEWTLPLDVANFGRGSAVGEHTAIVTPAEPVVGGFPVGWTADRMLDLLVGGQLLDAAESQAVWRVG